MRGRLVQCAAAVVALVLTSALAAGCSSPVSPPFGAPYSQTDLVVGTGDPINDGHTVTITYTGWLYDPTRPEQKGAVFETTTGGNPVEVIVSSGDLIEGFERALLGMRVGGLRRAVV